MPIAIHMLNNAFVIGASFLISREKIMSFADFSNYTTFFPGLIIFITGLNLVLIFYLLIVNIGVKKCQLYMQSRKRAFQM